MVRSIWGPAKYASTFGQGEDIQHAKRVWAGKILEHPREQLDYLLAEAQNKRVAGDPDFVWPDIAVILGQVQTNWEHARQSRPAHEVLSAPIIDKGADQFLLPEYTEEELNRSPAEHLQNLRGMFGDSNAEVSS